MKSTSVENLLSLLEWHSDYSSATSECQKSGNACLSTMPFTRHDPAAVLFPSSTKQRPSWWLGVRVS